ncbi:hypothetical protein Droror1_Dr00020614 [Drosera rotundifolia]
MYPAESTPRRCLLVVSLRCRRAKKTCRLVCTEKTNRGDGDDRGKAAMGYAVMGVLFLKFHSCAAQATKLTVPLNGEGNAFSGFSLPDIISLLDTPSCSVLASSHAQRAEKPTRRRCECGDERRKGMRGRKLRTMGSTVAEATGDGGSEIFEMMNCTVDHVND